MRGASLGAIGIRVQRFLGGGSLTEPTCPFKNHVWQFPQIGASHYNPYYRDPQNGTLHFGN